MRHTGSVSDPRGDVDAVVAALTVVPDPLGEAVAALPTVPGRYAWWAPPAVLPVLGGTPHPVVADLRLLDIGAATMLRNRITRQHLYRTGVSELRRVLSGLLLEELALAPTWAADVVLPRADEERLTAWMRERLLLTWTDLTAPLDELVAATRPGITADEPVAVDALARYTAAAGEKTVKVIGVPFRRP